MDAPKKDKQPRDVGHKAPNIRLKAPATSNAKSKLHIGFDAGERKSYLKGFSDRKADRRRYGLAMGELKRKRACLEERKEQREIDREGRLAALIELEETGGLDVATLEPQAPVTAEFDDSATRNMFGDVVQVVTTLDSLGTEDEDDAEAKAFIDDLAAKRQRLADDAKTAPKGRGVVRTRGPVDEAQKYAYSFKAIKEKIDATPLTTKRQRQAKRNKASSHLEGKSGGGAGARGAKGGGGGGKGKGEKKGKFDAGKLASMAIKTATFGKKNQGGAKKK